MVRIAIFGDFNPYSEPHLSTDKSLALAAASHDIEIQSEWIATRKIAETDLRLFDGFIINTGVYENRDAVLEVFRFAREKGIPTIAACGGFQHMVIEYARNVVGLRDVGHAEFDPHNTEHIIIPLECSLRGREGEITLVPDSQVGRLYRSSSSIEKFYCSFGINPAYLPKLLDGSLQIVGSDEHGRERITELAGHPFYVGTLFVPQVSALKGESHPIVEGFLVQARKMTH